MRITMALLAFSLVFAACSGGGGATSTPEGTFEAVKSKAAAKDWGGFYDLISPSARAKAEKRWEEEGKKRLGSAESQMMLSMLGFEAKNVQEMSLREFFVEFLGKLMEMGGPQVEQLAAFANAAITDKKIEGDRATLMFKAGEKEEEMKLVKEGGSWYMGDELLKGMPGTK